MTKRIYYYHPKIVLNFFEQIDTKKKAYWLGILYADGFIKTNKNKPYRIGKKKFEISKKKLMKLVRVMTLYKIGDIYVNYDNNFKIYEGWRDELTRGLETGDKLRRPQHIKRPWVPLSDKAYKVEIK